MSKSHWIVIGIGLALFLMLSFLPTVVVESDVVELATEKGIQATEEVIEHAQSNLTAEQKVSIAVARRTY